MCSHALGFEFYYFYEHICASVAAHAYVCAFVYACVCARACLVVCVCAGVSACVRMGLSLFVCVCFIFFECVCFCVHVCGCVYCWFVCAAHALMRVVAGAWGWECVFAAISPRPSSF